MVGLQVNKPQCIFYETGYLNDIGIMELPMASNAQVIGGIGKMVWDHYATR